MRGRAPEVEHSGVHARERGKGDLPEPLAESRMRVDQLLDLGARIAQEPRASDDGFDREGLLVRAGEAEEVAGREEVHDLSLAIGGERALARHAGGDPGPEPRGLTRAP